MRKPDFCLGENKGADQLRGNQPLISAFVFATRIVQFLFYLNPKFQASSSFLSLYRPVCVGPGRKPRRPVFSRRGSNSFSPVIPSLLVSPSIRIILLLVMGRSTGWVLVCRPTSLSLTLHATIRTIPCIDIITAHIF